MKGERKKNEMGPYWEKLNCNAKQQYLDKLSTIDWITDTSLLPQTILFLDWEHTFCVSLKVTNRLVVCQWLNVRSANSQACICKSTVTLVMVRWHYWFWLNYYTKQNIKLSKNIHSCDYFNELPKVGLICQLPWLLSCYPGLPKNWAKQAVT